MGLRHLFDFRKTKPLRRQTKPLATVSPLQITDSQLWGKRQRYRGRRTKHQPGDSQIMRVYRDLRFACYAWRVRREIGCELGIEMDWLLRNPEIEEFHNRATTQLDTAQQLRALMNTQPIERIS